MTLVVNANIRAQSTHELVVVLLGGKVISRDDDVDLIALLKNTLRNLCTLSLATVVWLNDDAGRESDEFSKPVLECRRWDNDKMWSWMASLD